jgi:hypothetical protein
MGANALFCLALTLFCLGSIAEMGSISKGNRITLSFGIMSTKRCDAEKASPHAVGGKFSARTFCRNCNIRFRS